jgi:hypothetical protein
LFIKSPLCDKIESPKTNRLKGGLKAMRTIFVIGAGAGVEIRMPDGNSLKKNIAELLELKRVDRIDIVRDNAIYQTLVNSVPQSNGFPDDGSLTKLLNAAKNIASAMPHAISIDNYIDARRGNQEIELCGKIAIVRSILEAERNSALFAIYDKFPPLDTMVKKVGAINNSWYPLVFQKITEGCSVEELPERLDNISFIIFNYDRCFEYFMYNVLMLYYDMNPHTAEETVQNLHIIHPYGTVGDLWSANGSITFGVDPSSTQHLLELSRKIKTFTESNGDEEEKGRDRNIKYVVERADRIIFLGFAYHAQNLDILFKRPGVLYTLDGVPISKHIACYGTGYNISENDLRHIHSLLEQSSDKIKECNVVNATCAQFFQEFWHRLSFTGT